MKRRARGALLLCGVLALLSACDRKPAPEPQPTTAPSAAADAAPARELNVHEKVLLAPVYEVDRIYRSMTGPQSSQDVVLDEDRRPELLWIVGFEATMVEPDGVTPAPQEFMCHTNLDLDATEHLELFGGEKRISGRLFTISQGQHRIDLPAGHGIPVLAGQALSLNTQVLNLNMKEGKRRVRHKVTIRYVRDAELSQPYRALFPAAAYGLKLLEGPDGHFGVDAGAELASADHGPGCMPGETASEHELGDENGRTFTGHWVVRPGREVNHTRVTKIMDLPFDTTLHYVAVHLHPFGESLELKDATAGTRIFEAHAKQPEQGVGLAHVDHFSSTSGVRLYRDHEYEIVSVYDNTSGEDQDSMAVMNLYLADQEFRKPEPEHAKRLLEQMRARRAGEGPESDSPGASGKMM